MKTPHKIYLKDYKPPEFLVDRVDLIFEIEKDKTMVTSNLKIRKNVNTDKNTPLVLDKGEFEIASVVAGGMVLLPEEYKADDEVFKLARTPAEFELEIKSILRQIGRAHV